MPKNLVDHVAATFSLDELAERRRALTIAQEVMDEIERCAERLLGKASDAAEALSEMPRQLFWTLIYYQAAEHTMMPRSIPRGPVMAEREQRTFRHEKLPLGRYRGLCVGDVPSGYLVWLANLPEEHGEFLRNLRRYLRSGASHKGRPQRKQP